MNIWNLLSLLLCSAVIGGFDDPAPIPKDFDQEIKIRQDTILEISQSLKSHFPGIEPPFPLEVQSPPHWAEKKDELASLEVVVEWTIPIGSYAYARSPRYPLRHILVQYDGDKLKLKEDRVIDLGYGRKVDPIDGVPVYRMLSKDSEDEDDQKMMRFLDAFIELQDLKREVGALNELRDSIHTFRSKDGSREIEAAILDHSRGNPRHFLLQKIDSNEVVKMFPEQVDEASAQILEEFRLARLEKKRVEVEADRKEKARIAENAQKDAELNKAICASWKTRRLRIEVLKELQPF